MISLNQLRVFWAVAHSESLTRAAKQLGVTQPALSQQLAKLENALGGLLGLSVGVEEGIELNLLGLVLGVDPKRLGIKLPGIGQLGMG